MKRVLFAAAAAAVLLLSACESNSPADSVSAAPTATKPSSFDATMKADYAAATGGPSIKPYPFNTCAVQIHRPFKGGKPKHRRIYQGYEVLVCCDPCVYAFDQNPEPFMPRIREAADRKEGG